MSASIQELQAENARLKQSMLDCEANRKATIAEVDKAYLEMSRGNAVLKRQYDSMLTMLKEAKEKLSDAIRWAEDSFPT